MNMVALFDAKNRLSELCNKVVESGQPCVISRRGKPVVKLVPVEADDSGVSVWDSIEESQTRYGALEVDFVLPKRTDSQRLSDLN